MQDGELEGLSKLSSRWLASVPGEDSGVVGWPGTGEAEARQAVEEEDWAKGLPS